jgi:hypothetical protein
MPPRESDDAAQEAWKEYLDKNFFHRDNIYIAHRAFIAGYKAAEETRK